MPFFHRYTCYASLASRNFQLFSSVFLQRRFYLTLRNCTFSKEFMVRAKLFWRRTKLLQLYWHKTVFLQFAGHRKNIFLWQRVLENHIKSRWLRLFIFRRFTSWSGWVGYTTDVPHQSSVPQAVTWNLMQNSLTVLDISGNSLNRLDEFCGLSRLTTLVATHNEFSDIDALLIMLESFRDLGVLNLSENPFTKKLRYREKVMMACTSLSK